MVEWRLWELPNKMGPSRNIPRCLTIHQCYTHRTGAKFVWAQACPWRANGWACTIFCTSEYFFNKGPTCTYPPGGRPFLLDFWNHVAFEKLVNGTFTTATGYLGKARGTQSKEKRHHTFLNLVLEVKLREAVIFGCAREKEGGLKPRNLAYDKMGIIDETIASVLAGKIRTKKYPPVLRWIHTTKRLFFPCGHHRGCVWIGRAETFREFVP